MSSLPLTVKTPGKIMIAGEFAVLEPYYKLIVMAVNRYVYTTVETSNINSITLENFDLKNITWSYTRGNIDVDVTDHRVRYTAKALEVVCTYLEEQEIAQQPVHLKIKSELDDPTGKKYGLGSSAAVVTSVISAMLHAHLPQTPEPDLVFKLGAITHVLTQGNGSGADVAASAYGGFIEYVSFRADWLIHQVQAADTLTNLVESAWKYLSIKPFQLPDSVHMAIGWTGTPASTPELVDRILLLKTHNPPAYAQFLQQSQQAVTAFIQGAKEDNTELLQQGIRQNRQALARVGVDAGVEIETDMLRTLSDLAETHGGTGKSSGAGGGDCGLAFMATEAEVQTLHKVWEQAGIESLSLETAPLGAAKIYKQD